MAELSFQRHQGFWVPSFPGSSRCNFGAVANDCGKYLYEVPIRGQLPGYAPQDQCNIRKRVRGNRCESPVGIRCIYPTTLGVEKARQSINEYYSAPPSYEYLFKAQGTEGPPEMEISDVP